MGVDRIDGGTVELAGQTLPVEIRVDPRARRLILRLARPNTVRVTCPSKRHVRAALKMVTERKDWITDRLGEAATPIPFTPGTILPVLGTPTLIVADPNPRRAARLEHDQLITGGITPKAMARRVETSLRKVALDACQVEAQRLAALANVSVRGVKDRALQVLGPDQRPARFDLGRR